jgi:hypothetical protein
METTVLARHKQIELIETIEQKVSEYSKQEYIVTHYLVGDKEFYDPDDARKAFITACASVTKLRKTAQRLKTKKIKSEPTIKQATVKKGDSIVIIHNGVKIRFIVEKTTVDQGVFLLLECVNRKNCPDATYYLEKRWLEPLLAHKTFRLWSHVQWHESVTKPLDFMAEIQENFDTSKH